MTHASLFSGIGGAEIAATWMGWQNLFHCEIQEFPRKVLEYWYPNSISYEDITKTDFTPWRGRIDVLTGGFPCQPFSCAGQRKGADDNRYLWPEMLRAIREIQPTWVVGENVAGLLSMVQPGEEVDMGGAGSLFEENHIYRKEQRFTLDEICDGLERAGYAVQPFVVPACAVGAPHRRDRLWIVAHATEHGDSGRPAELRQEKRRPQERLHEQPLVNGSIHPAPAPNAYEHTSPPQGQGGGTESGGRRHVPQPCERRDEAERPDGLPRLQRSACDTDGTRLERGARTGLQGREYGFADASLPADRWRDFPTQSPVCTGNDGISGRLAGITFPRWRAEAIKALGNSWVPQVAYEIFRAIEITEHNKQRP